MWMYVKGRAVRLGIDEGLLSSELDLIDVSLKRKKMSPELQVLFQSMKCHLALSFYLVLSV